MMPARGFRTGRKPAGGRQSGMAHNQRQKKCTAVTTTMKVRVLKSASTFHTENRLVKKFHTRCFGALTNINA